MFSLAKNYNAVTVVDMAQTAGLVDLDITQAKCDFAVFAGHKTLYGPTGVSGFLLNPAVDLPTVLYGGTGVDSANQDMPENLPARYEMGTPNMMAIAGLHAALKELKKETIAHRYAVEQKNRHYLMKILKGYDFIKFVGLNDSENYVGVVSFQIDGISSDSSAQIFSRLNIDLRTGLQCAPLAHKFLGTYPAGTVRVSVGVYSSSEDFIQLKNALEYIDENI